MTLYCEQIKSMFGGISCLREAEYVLIVREPKEDNPILSQFACLPVCDECVEGALNSEKFPAVLKFSIGDGKI